MTSGADRRLAKLEGALRPREAVLAWLADAQRYSTINEYGQWIAEVPLEAAPLSVIARQVDAATRQDMKGQPANEVEDAVRRSIRDAVFLFVLALQINIDAVEMAKVEGLRAAAVFFWMGCLLGGPRDEDIAAQEVADYRRESADAWATWGSVVDRLDEGVQVAAEARAILSREYYRGNDVLFADAATSWAEHVETVTRLKSLAESMTHAAKASARSVPGPTIPPHRCRPKSTGGSYGSPSGRGCVPTRCWESVRRRSRSWSAGCFVMLTRRRPAKRHRHYARIVSGQSTRLDGRTDDPAGRGGRVRQRSLHPSVVL